jgi:hypothetical protein
MPASPHILCMDFFLKLNMLGVFDVSVWCAHSVALPCAFIVQLLMHRLSLQDVTHFNVTIGHHYSHKDHLMQIISRRPFHAGPLMNTLSCTSSRADVLMQDSLMKILWRRAFPWEHMGAYASAAAQQIPIPNHRTSPSQQSMKTTMKRSSSNQRQPSSQMVLFFLLYMLVASDSWPASLLARTCHRQWLVHTCA